MGATRLSQKRGRLKKETREEISGTPFVEVRDSSGKFLYVDMAPGKEYLGGYVLGGYRLGKPIIDRFEGNMWDRRMYAMTCRRATKEEAARVRVTRG